MKRTLFSAAFALSALAAPAAHSQSTASYDGKWSVLIVTEQGNCDRAYRYPLIIRDGLVTYGGRNNFNVSGRVQADGAVRVRVTQGDQGADGTGQLRGKYGSGTWTAPTGGCSGKWQADKRG